MMNLKSEKTRQFNPLSDFIKPLKDGTLPTNLQSQALKTSAFFADVYNVKAYVENNTSIRLGDEGANLEDVDRINGFWCVQKDFPYTITNVRGKDMVLIKKLNRVENTFFEFWSGKMVAYNCYGPFVFDGDIDNYIVAMYDTDNGPRMAYGKTIDAARAYLGMKLYDETKDIINGILCQNKLKTNSK